MRVAVLKGGRSLERAVSLQSGARVEDAVSALGHEVTDVFIDGRAVMRGGKITSVDETAVLARSRAAADSLAARSGSDRFKARPWRSMAF